MTDHEYYSELGSFLDTSTGKELRKRLALESAKLMFNRNRILNIDSFDEINKFKEEYIILQKTIKMIDNILSDVLNQDFNVQQILNSEPSNIF